MRIEDKVNELVELCVLDRMDLNVEHLAYMFDAHILYNHKESFYGKKAGIDIIGLKFNTRYEMFKDFCHEAGHMFLHQTHQNTMADRFNALQEAEANKFGILLMMPEKLITANKLYDAQSLMSYFNVTEDLALQRIDMLVNYSKVAQVRF